MPASEHTTTGSAGAPPPRRLMYLAVAGAAVLVLAGGAAFYYATLRNRDSGKSVDYHRVAVTATACEPNEMTVPGGKRSFEILNTSSRPIEWEILDGVMVVAERENIAPGFKQTLTVQLVPGDYAITCGLLSNPRGVLHVTDSEEARQAAAKVSLSNFLGPLSEHKVYLFQQSSAALAATEELAEAIKAGDLEQARMLWVKARVPYKHVEPVAYRFSDLENAIDPVADYLAQRENDPGFTGFHRIEYGLFAQRSLDGLAPIADQLVTDMTALKARLVKAKLDPGLLLAIPGDTAAQLAQGKILSGEDHYAHTDMVDIAASFEGIRKVTDLLRPVVKPVDPRLEAEIAAKLDAVQTRLSALRGGDGFPSYDSVDETTRKALTKEFQDLAETLNRLGSVIGVS